jgi:hypothetical protein
MRLVDARNGGRRALPFSTLRHIKRIHIAVRPHHARIERPPSISAPQPRIHIHIDIDSSEKVIGKASQESLVFLYRADRTTT